MWGGSASRRQGSGVGTVSVGPLFISKPELNPPCVRKQKAISPRRSRARNGSLLGESAFLNPRNAAVVRGTHHFVINPLHRFARVGFELFVVPRVTVRECKSPG